jgi:hypothetical protein
MPSHDRVGSHNGDGSDGVRDQPIDQDKDQAIQATQSHALRRLPSKNAQLMAEDENFSLEPRPRLEPRRDDSD